MGEEIFSSPHPGNNPYPLLRRRRVYFLGQNEAGHCNEQGPEYFLRVLILKKNASIAASVSAFIAYWLNFGKNTSNSRTGPQHR
jgi:hypothetical protein